MVASAAPVGVSRVVRCSAGIGHTGLHGYRFVMTGQVDGGASGLLGLLSS